MNYGFYLKKFTVLPLILLLSAVSLLAQTVQKAPRQEKLLNGLKVLMWSDPAAADVSVRIRIHSGSAFDPQGKEGLMKLLSENIFPNETLRDYFSEDLGGSLEIIQNYDFIQINASSKPEEFLNLLETLASALANPQIDKETTAKLKAAQLEKISELEKNPAYVADRTAANRLLGNFPYGRPAIGTAESLQKIDFADLIFAKERFLSADNATLTIAGNFKPDLAFRALRRYFGAWSKSDRLAPSTFRQPDEPDTKMFSVKMPTGGNSELRYAMRGLSRSDKDFPASAVLTRILHNRLQAQAPKEFASNIFVRHDEHILPGLIVFGYTSTAAPAGEIVQSGGESAKNSPPNAVASIISQPVKADEFAKARAEVLAELGRKNAADWWLDVDTFKINSVADELKSFESLTQTDVQRVAEKLQKNPVVSVSLIPTSEEAPKN